MQYNSSLSSRLDQKAEIKVLGRSRVKDDLGQYPVEPQTVATVWAGVIPQTGSLLTGRVAETQISRTTHKVLIRYRPGITPDMWLEIAGQRFDILYILDPYMRHEQLELFCEVRVDGD